MESTLLTGEPHNEEEGKLTVLVEGEKKSLNLLISTKLIGTNSIKQVLVSITDITRIKQAEMSLAKTKEQYLLAVKGSQDGIWDWDITDNELFLSPRWKEIIGYQDHELPNKFSSFEEHLHPDDKQGVLEYVDQYLNGHLPVFTIEFRLRHKDGSYRWILSRGEALWDKKGHPYRMAGSHTDITERKHNEQYYKMIAEMLDNAPNAITIHDFESRFLYANRKTFEIHGYEKDEFMALTLQDIDVSESEALMKERMQIVAEKGEASFIVEHFRKDGSTIPMEIFVKKVEWNNEPAMMSIATDITERNKADAKLRQSEERLNLSERIGKLGNWEYNIADNTLVWSDQAYNLLERDPESGHPAVDEEAIYYSKETFTRLRGYAKQVIKSGEPIENYEFAANLASGRKPIFIGSMFPIKDTTGRVVKLFGTFQDITEGKSIEENYKTLFHEMLDGFAQHEIICDEAGSPIDYRFLAVNPAFERMTGLKASDIVGRTVLEVIPGTEQHWIETYGRVALTGEPNFFENSAKNLEKHFQVAAFCPQPGQFACMFVDITDRKNAEKERQTLETHLQHAQKMEAIGTLAGGIAHDFNNILGAILGYAEMAYEDSLSGSVKPSDLNQVVQASHRAKDLVKQILAFSRQAEAQKIPLRPAALVKETIKLLRSSIPTTIDIQQDIDSEADLILADPTQIHQIMMNLCTNAFHAMEETGGTLSISLKNKTLTQLDLVSLPSVQPGQFVQLFIGDTGSGIAPEIQNRIFDPYFTTKEQGKGTGMGLAIVHGIAKSYGGFVTCHSEIGAGTVFELCLPALLEQIVPESKKFEMNSVGTERILFIDDEEILAKMGQTMLERLGYTVTVEVNSLEALATFKNQPEAFDLVITDQTMPGMTGTDLARRILQIRPGMPIILCTGYSSQVTKEQTRSFGIKGFALKPLSRKDIAVLIRTVLD